MILRVFLYIFLLLYTFIFYLGVDSSLEQSFRIGSMILYIVLAVSFLVEYRRSNIIFCPEFFFLLFGFIIAFFDLIVLNNVLTYSSLYDSFLDKYKIKSLSLSMVSEIVFILGAMLAEKMCKKKSNIMQQIKYINIPSIALHILNIIVAVIIFYYYFSGIYISFMKYKTGIVSENLSSYFTIPSVFMMVASVLEILHLFNCKSNITSFKDFLFKINNLYLFNFVFITFFLYLTGNRNDMLLIFMPPIIVYFYCIKKITNKVALISLLVGFLGMVLIGLVRGNDNSNIEKIDLMSIFRDFGAAYVNQQGLINYTDIHGTYGYSAGVQTIISSIPFLGGAVYNKQDIEYNSSRANTNILTTEQWQTANNSDSGLGTSLIGDLYYAGGIEFVFLYMFLLGYFFSHCNYKLIRSYKLNISTIIVFCWFFSDVVYLQRATYYSLFRFIGFSIIIYLVVKNFFIVRIK